MLDDSVSDSELLTFPLCDAVDDDNLEEVQRLVEGGNDINEVDTTRWGYTPLMRAAIVDSTEITRYLLQQGADVSLVSVSGNNALMEAVWKNHPNVLRVLLEHGAPMNCVDCQGYSALMISTVRNKRGDRTECAKLLLAHGAALGIRDEEGRSAKDLALENGYEEIAALIEAEEKSRSTNSCFLQFLLNI